MTVSMVIPTLGQRLPYLRLCVDSILDTDVDVAVCMVAPPEQTDDLRRHFPEIPVFAQEGRGLATAIEEGWAQLRPSTYLAWLGDDDLLTHGSLRGAVAALEARPGAAMVFGRTLCIDQLGRPIFIARPGRQARWILRLGKNLIAQPGCLYRASTVVAIGGLDTNLRLAFDVDLHRRLIDAGHAIYLPQTLGLWREHQSSLTVANNAASREEAQRALLRQMNGVSPAGQRTRLAVGRRLGGLSARLTWRTV